MVATEELHERAKALMNRGRFGRARVLLERARSTAGTPELLTQVEASLAFVWCETGATDDALALCQEALGRPGISDATTGLLHGQIGLIHMLAGETDRALTHFGLAIASPMDDLALGRAYLNRGGVFLQQSRTALAHSDFERAESHLSSAGDTFLTAMAAHNLGYTQLLEGDLVGALCSMTAAYEVLAPEGPVSLATCEQDRAEVLISAGLVTEGRTALREASRAFGSRRLYQRQGDAEMTLARTLVHTDPDLALQAARKARRLYVRTGSGPWRVRAEAVILAAEVERGRRQPAMVTRADQLAPALRDQGLQWGAAQVCLHAVRVLVRGREFDEARSRLGRVRVGADAPLGVRLLARTARVELARAQGRRVAALQHARAGLADLHAWQSTFGSLDLQTGVVGQGRRLGIHGLELAVELGRPPLLFEWSERARMLASRVLPVRPPADEETAADLAELRRLNAGSDGSSVPAPRRVTELRRRVRERAWQNPGSGEVTEPACLDDLRPELGTDTALVAWVVAGDRVAALVVTDREETIHDLCSFSEVREMLRGLLPDLDVASSELPAALAAVVRRGLAARLDDLAAVLVAPLLDEIGDRRVVATPSGGLAGTPWTLLPGLVGRPVTVAQSATAWLQRRREPLDLTTAGFVAGPRVARAEAEVTDASRRWPGAELIAGEKADAEGVSALAGRVDVLHVAAHGRHSADNALFSGLELVDGPWFGYDIDHLASVPQVVVLSACEVGRSSVRFGEELIGMTAAWLHAGARCVVASPSAVADEAAHDVLTRMHEHLARGLDPAAALAAAVPPVGEHAPPAPFVCFGVGW